MRPYLGRSNGALMELLDPLLRFNLDSDSDFDIVPAELRADFDKLRLKFERRKLKRKKLLDPNKRQKYCLRALIMTSALRQNLSVFRDAPNSSLNYRAALSKINHHENELYWELGFIHYQRRYTPTPFIKSDSRHTLAEQFISTIPWWYWELRTVNAWEIESFEKRVRPVDETTESVRCVACLRDFLPDDTMAFRILPFSLQASALADLFHRTNVGAQVTLTGPQNGLCLNKGVAEALDDGTIVLVPNPRGTEARIVVLSPVIAQTHLIADSRIPKRDWANVHGLNDTTISIRSSESPVTKELLLLRLNLTLWLRRRHESTYYGEDVGRITETEYGRDAYRTMPFRDWINLDYPILGRRKKPISNQELAFFQLRTCALFDWNAGFNPRHHFQRYVHSQLMEANEAVAEDYDVNDHQQIPVFIRKAIAELINNGSA